MRGLAPVAIVGAGPVAMTTALVLARLGVETLLLEAKESRDRVGSKALCMQRDALDVLERVGVGAALAEEGVTWTLGRTYYRDHELFQIRFPELGQARFPPFVNVGQERTEHWLERAIEENPLCEIRYGHRVIDLINREDSVEVLVEGHDAVRVQYLVAADGARSDTRRLLGIDFPGHSFDDRFLICDIRADLPFANERRFFFDPEWNPGRQVLIHPQADSVWRIDWQVPPNFDAEREYKSGALEQRIRKIVGDRDYEIVWLSAYRFHQRVADRFRSGRCFLVGDAAHLYAPFGARGLNSGVHDAENLAWKLAFHLKGHSPESILDTYATERRAAALENLRVTGHTMEFLVPSGSDALARRHDILESAVRNPTTASEVDSGKLAEPYWYLDSPLTLAKPPAGFPTEPGIARPVVPGVLCPDGPVNHRAGRLRSIFGPAVIVLAWGDPRVEYCRSFVRAYDLTTLDPDGALSEALPTQPGEAWVVRPDGYLAARVPNEPGSLLDATLRAVGAVPRARDPGRARGR